MRVEANAIIGDFEIYPFKITFHLYLYVARASVLDGVVEGLLGYAVDGLLDLRRGLRLVAESGLNLDLVACPQSRRLFLQRHHEPLGLQRLRPQLEDQGSHLSQAGLRQGEGVVEGFGRLIRIALHQGARRLGAQGYAVEGLGDGIVQLAGEALTLFESGLAAGLGEEASVLDRHGGLVGDGLKEDLLFLAGLPSGEVAEKDGAHGPVPGDERQAVGDVPRHLAREAVYGGVAKVLQEKTAEVADEHGLPGAEGPQAGGRGPGPVGGLQARCVPLWEAV